MGQRPVDFFGKKKSKQDCYDYFKNKLGQPG
jgi:hypothetical protein